MRLSFHLALLLVLPLFPLAAEEVLTNEGVTKMVAAGLGEELIVAKIKEAPEIAFRLEIDDLIALRSSGASERVIQAMLERSATPKEEGKATWNGEDLGFEVVKVSLASAGAATSLSLLRGEMGSSGFGPYRNTFMNYPGLHARTRTQERRPSLLVRSKTPLSAGRYFLAKLDPDTDDEVRSLKISSFRNRLRGAFGGRGQEMEPDADWTVPYEAVEESPGLWRVRAARELQSGEYGWYVDLGTGMQSAGIFDFGVD